MKRKVSVPANPILKRVPTVNIRGGKTPWKNQQVKKWLRKKGIFGQLKKKRNANDAPFLSPNLGKGKGFGPDRKHRSHLTPRSTYGTGRENNRGGQQSIRIGRKQTCANGLFRKENKTSGWSELKLRARPRQKEEDQ